MNTTRKEEKIIAATGGPAFPALGRWGNGPAPESALQQDGMTLREYAAIKLKVPDSGKPWLDEMITESLRDEVASKAVHAIMSTPKTTYLTGESLALLAYTMADSFLAVRKGQ